MRYIILTLFVVHMILLAWLNNWYVSGLPLRSFFIIAIGGLVLLQGLSYATDLRLLNGVYVLILAVGCVVSVANNSDSSEIAAGVFRLVQSWLFIVSGYYLLINFGYRSVPLVLLLAAVPSAAVGVLQGMDVEFAWQLREFVGGFLNTPFASDVHETFIVARERPPGLELFAISQSYLLFAGLVMALFLYIRSYERDQRGWFYLLLVIVLLAGCVASGTRSVLVGAAVMVFLTLLRVNFSVSMLVGLVFLVGAGVLQWSSNDSRQVADNNRLFNLEDQSAKGRTTLYKYGGELVIRQPWGYGYGFSSKELAMEYFINDQTIFSYEPTAKVQYLVEVHNAFLNLLHIYGIPGLLILLIYLAELSRVRWFFFYVLIGYILNSFFHNNGIFLGDLYIDAVIALIFYYKYYVTSQLREEERRLSGSSLGAPA